MAKPELKVQESQTQPQERVVPRTRPRRRLFGRIVALAFLLLVALLVLFAWQGVNALNAMQVSVQHAASGLTLQGRELHVVGMRLQAIQAALQAIGQAIAHLGTLVSRLTQR